MRNLENQCVLHFECQRQRFLRLYHDTYIPLFRIDLSTKPFRVYDLIQQISRFLKICP